MKLQKLPKSQFLQAECTPPPHPYVNGFFKIWQYGEILSKFFYTSTNKNAAAQRIYCTAASLFKIYFFFRRSVFVTAVVGLTAGERLGFGMRALAAGSPRASTFTNSCWMVSLFSSVTARTSA